MQECVLDEMAQFVDFLVVFPHHFTIFSRRDNWLHALFFRLLHDGVAVVAAVGQQVLSVDPFDQPVSLCAICGGTLRNNNSDRHTKRIHGQM